MKAPLRSDDGEEHAKEAWGRERVLVVGAASADPGGELGRLLAAEGCEVEGVAAPTEIKDDVCLLTIVGAELGEAEALECLRRLREQHPSLRVVLVGAPGGAAAAFRAQAFDYLEEPVTPPAVAGLIRRARLTPDPRQASLLDSLQLLTPGLVHELRNPLSGILAGSQMLARLLRGEGNVCEYAGIVQEEAQQLERFLSRLAEFGRLRSGGVRFADSLDLAALLARLMEVAAPGCTTRGIRLASSFDPQAGAVRGDAGRLTQAFGEIFQNAQEATPGGGCVTIRTRRVRAEAACHADWIEVEFCDTGPGLSAEARRRAFEPFFSTRPRALGIGLSLAQAIVRAHGGVIRLPEVAGRGGRVAVVLPATADAR